jgi:ribosomal protein S18 acetylase RimI-like enzyme
VYYAPTEMTDRTWELWWIVVDPSQQGRGLGRQMLKWVEDDIRRRNGRVLLIETSSTPHYEPTRRFYLKNGYTLAAQIVDFYADADDKVIFSKHLQTNRG